jgi:acetoin utilization protein AcuC
MQAAFVYSDSLSRFDYGSGHPLKPFRLKLTYELIRACGLLGDRDPRVIEPSPATLDDLLTFHTRDYLGVLQTSNNGLPAASAAAFGIGPGDNPAFPGMFDWSALIAGASLRAADLVDSGEATVAFNIAGGLHHALAGRASGFCYINDPVLAIRRLTNRGRRVAYIDIDAHHGDGVQEAFYDTDRVMTISLHETGRMLFPGTGFEHETGAGHGMGYSVNIPLPPEADDETFLRAFTGIVPALIDAFRPDIVVSQLGVDTFRTDPLAHLNITTNGFCEVVRLIRSLAPKWVALGGGGYDIANVARAWTLAWAVMNDADAPAEVPEPFLRQYPHVGFTNRKLRDECFEVTGSGTSTGRSPISRSISSGSGEARQGRRASWNTQDACRHRTLPSRDSVSITGREAQGPVSCCSMPRGETRKCPGAASGTSSAAPLRSLRLTFPGSGDQTAWPAHRCRPWQQRSRSFWTPCTRTVSRSWEIPSAPVWPSGSRTSIRHMCRRSSS